MQSKLPDDIRESQLAFAERATFLQLHNAMRQHERHGIECPFPKEQDRLIAELLRGVLSRRFPLKERKA